ncbi:TetR/AcrR family transcriptional regulator, partial [Dermacoccus nishinomiyaensis]|uniref:TetR/AcrR family transcriptional regulator n=1 Tax=Dermacoccus nishinomiyaensis TaxID=1274 RepID=UPI00248D9FDF
MTTKSEQTREALVETALAMFREHGYEKTTMRAIAAEAGVSQGNAYYYFDGKDALVQQLYLRLQAEHRDAALAAVRDGAPLADNL